MARTIAGARTTAGDRTIAGTRTVSTRFPVDPQITDSFTRANSTTTLGSTEGGGLPWTVINGDDVPVWGISSNQAYQVTGGVNGCVVVDPGKSDVDISVTISTIGGLPGIYFRVTNGINYWRLLNANNGFLLQKRVGGGYTTVFDLVAVVANGSTLRVRAVGSSIQCFLNGGNKGSIVDSTLSTSTKHGLGFATSSGATRFDNFSLSYPI